MAIHEVTGYGAIGDGCTVSTAAIQAAVDAAAGKGGGVVLVPPGVWRTGMIRLRDRITLSIQPGATLLGSPDIADYPAVQSERSGDRHMHHLIVAEGVSHVTLTGGGTIDGNGAAFWEAPEGPRAWIKAKSPRVSPMFDFVRCADLRIENLTIQNSPGWTLHPHMCDRVWIRGIRLLNPLFGPNTDGIDLNGCRDVFVSDCHIECGDDAIVLKTTEDSRSVERVTVTNCTIRTNCVALKLGAKESFHDMRHIAFSNCVVYASTRAVGIYNFCGCVEENIVVSNIVCDTDTGVILNRPIHIDARRHVNGPGIIRNVQIANVVARTDGRILLTAADGYEVRNVVLRDVRMSYPIVDDPAPTASGSRSDQFSVHSPEARAARAVVVADGIERLVIDNLAVDWPAEDDRGDWAGLKTRAGDPAPYPGRAENGGDPPFAVLWARRCSGYFRAPLAEANREGVERLHLEDSPMQVLQ